MPVLSVVEGSNSGAVAKEDDTKGIPTVCRADTCTGQKQRGRNLIEGTTDLLAGSCFETYLGFLFPYAARRALLLNHVIAPESARSNSNSQISLHPDHEYPQAGIEDTRTPTLGQDIPNRIMPNHKPTAQAPHTQAETPRPPNNAR